MKLPLPLLKIIESISEDLPDDESQAFTAAINAAAKGKDLSLAHWAFLGAELRALPDDLPDHIQALVDQVITGMDRLAAGKEWHEAAKAASICHDIAMDSTPEYAACAAYAAYSAAYSAVRQRQGDRLLALIKSANAKEAAKEKAHG